MDNNKETTQSDQRENTSKKKPNISEHDKKLEAQREADAAPLLIRTISKDMKEDPSMKIAVDFIHEDNNFLLAAQIGDYKKLEHLLRWGADVQQKDYLGRNALHFAVQTGREDIIQLLLRHGINASLKDHLGMSPLSLCLMRNPSVKLAKLLYKHGARLHKRIPGKTNTMDTGLFMQFVMMCEPTLEDEEILHVLVDTYGALVDDPGAPGQRQALHFAAMSDNPELIRILIDLGADTLARNHRNETPLDVAIKFRCKRAAAKLLSVQEARRTLATQRALAMAELAIVKSSNEKLASSKKPSR